VIREFKSRGLKLDEQRLGPGALPQPLEANYKDEFYRACYTLLGDIYLSSEWSGKEKTGRVDFMVKSRRWAIECVKDGNRLDDISPGGRYFPWVFSGEVQSTSS
jgi:hypothetical protein